MSTSGPSDQYRHSGKIGFGVFFQGVNFGTIWNHETSGSQTDFESFRRVIQTAERGLFSAFFLGEGLRLREHRGELHELDIVGRPDAQVQLAALAAVTTHIGLVATQNTTYNDAATLAHRLASLDVLSGGRAAWNIVTTDNAWTGENFRRGGYLEHADRYSHAEFVVRTAKAIWDASDQTGFGTVSAGDQYGEITAQSRVPRSRQEHPVLFQAGDSAEGRDFAVRQADVIFSAHPEFDKAGEFAADIRTRLAAIGRPVDDVKIYPGAEFIVAATDAEAREKEAWIRQHQVSPQTALAFLEQVWGTDLSDYDADGPLPAIDPVVEELGGTRGALFQGRRAIGIANDWRAIAEAGNLSIRQLVIQISSKRSFVGGASSLADRLAKYASAGVVDGFNISPYLIPTGLDDVVNLLVPELQERGVYNTEYAGTTLRENLGLRAPLTRRGKLDIAGEHGERELRSA
jgi:alkanesulfonate monooxygenase SsuD/methylene tetrahydromethanopterin reductase-like flavin-dependent oxidoreductase (luciferase family)